MASRPVSFLQVVGPVLILLLFCAASVIAQDCSKNKPCATGCWRPTHLANSVITTTAPKPDIVALPRSIVAKGVFPTVITNLVVMPRILAQVVVAYCDPGYGAEWAEKAHCPLNVCCSKYGFCGITEEFCGNKTVKHETCSKDKYLSRVVGYYEGWSSRRGCNTVWPEQIKLGVYSHINFAFATIHPETYEVLPADERDVPLYKRLTDLKQYDPNLKVMIALGGWTFNDPGPTATLFSDLAASEEKQKKFFKSLVSFMSTYDFDGVDLDWEYPEASDRSGRPADYDNFPKFMANLKNSLDKTPGRSELSITLPASYWYLQHFDIKELAKHVSFFNIMTYDLHGTWDRGNKWTGEYLNAHTNLTEMKTAFDLLWRNDIDADMVTMGLAFYGRAYTVASPNCMEPGCLYLSGGKKGECSDETGVLLNSEIMDIMSSKQLSAKLYKDAAVKVVHWEDQWVSYDDKETFQIKTDFAREQCLGGVMVWAISHDTQSGTFAGALAAVSNRRVLAQRQVQDDDYVVDTTNYDTCKWSNCGEPCPSGWQMIKREDEWRRSSNDYMLDSTGCNGVGYRSWCCPPTTAPKCGWYSFNNGHCSSGCPSGSVEVGSTREGCKNYEFDYQAACCTIQDSDGSEITSMALYNTCEWAASPLCDTGVCSFKGTTKPTELVKSGTGSGGVYCLPNGKMEQTVFPKGQLSERKLCCNTNEATRKWEKCEWHNNIGLGKPGQDCYSGCPKDTIRVAMNTYNHGCYARGGQAFCCNANYYTESKRLSDDLQTFQDAVDAWIADPACVTETSTTQSVSARASKCDRGVLHMYLAQLFLRGLVNQDHWDAVAKIWNRVSDKFSHLGAESLFNFVTSKEKYPAYFIHGKDQTADEVLDRPVSFDLMIGGDPNFISCDLDLCTYMDCSKVDADESDDALAARDVLNMLIGRQAKDDDNGPTWFSCNDGLKKAKLQYTRADYPTISQWAPDEDAMKEAVDYESKEECTNCEVTTKQASKGDQKKKKYTTEHIIEVKTILRFLKWLIKHEECGVDCTFFAEYFFKAVLTGNNPPLPGGKNSQKPITRVMEALGSLNLRENFRLLEKGLNEIKGGIWGVKAEPKDWHKWITSDDPSPALAYLRNRFLAQVIAVYNYLNLPQVWSRFQATNRILRGQMQYVSDAYNTANKDNKDKKQIKLLECWDKFLAEFLKEMLGDSTKFIQVGIGQLRTYWMESRDPENKDWLTKVAQVKGYLDALEGKIGKVSLDLNHLV
ncbi:hypothetical protein GB937_010039 [Aspergillus fischeri]|nr:hypothetical protein GB937_010039 [Aspergillus fischeri]